jgi:uncharacterized protein
MRLALMTLIGTAALTTAFTCANNLTAAEAKPAKIKVLLITGDDVGVHPWRETTPATRDVLVAAGKFDVKVSEEPLILESAAALKNYDLIFLNYYNSKNQPLSDLAKENLLNFVKNGKGFAISHLASASWKEWDEFHKMVGRYWVMGKSGHGPRAPFKVKIKTQDNPITKGMQDFETDDELYAKLLGDVPITVLAEADSDWSKQTEPLVFTLQYGQGRVFHEAFGHDGKAVKTEGVAKFIQRGCEWAATGKVEQR